MSSGQYFESRPDSATRRRTVTLTLPDLTLELTTDAGVFAADRIDAGTKYLLLEAPPPPPTGQVVDLGCGYGAIALTLAHRSPAATIWAVDVNERALDLCRENAGALGLTNVRACTPEQVSPDLVVDGLYSNPPIRVGKTVLHELLLAWLDRLAPDAAAHLVVQKHLGSDSLARWLTDEGWPTTRIGSRAGYRLLTVTRAASDTHAPEDGD
jgi:16S rRNA (guanine1207-N2)-methyltransferase